jgi:hypothetical protein
MARPEFESPVVCCFIRTYGLRGTRLLPVTKVDQMFYLQGFERYRQRFLQKMLSLSAREVDVLRIVHGDLHKRKLYRRYLYSERIAV